MIVFPDPVSTVDELINEFNMNSEGEKLQLGVSP